ncbi:MAG TPA: hypothetical protein VFA99_14515 [Acidobacteriaceae bacterium]|nr:hypothetical protein [Acidobacteriaceae bacterium]
MLQGSANNALIDFSREKPELVRGLGPYRGKVNWDALELVVRTTEGSEFQKQYFRKGFLKAIRKHGLSAMTPWFRYHYACARLALGDFSDYWGWEFRGLSEKEKDNYAADVFWSNTWLDKWGGAPVDRLLVIGEGGVGDSVLLGTILPECLARAKEVIFECDERLHGLFERSFPRLKCKPDTTFDDPRESYGKIDAFILAMDLMRMFRRDIRHFPGKPYLKPDPTRVAEFEKFRGREGVAWKGRQGSFDPLALGLQHPISLQYKEFHRDIEQAPLDLWADIEGVVALCSVLSRVVTAPQSVYHFAGAQGVRVEVIEPEVRGEETGAVIWDRVLHYNDAKAPWYKDTRFFQSVAEWKKSSATHPGAPEGRP